MGCGGGEMDGAGRVLAGSPIVVSVGDEGASPDVDALLKEIRQALGH